MPSLKTKIKLYLEANSKTWDSEKNNIELRNDSDGNGDYINIWNVLDLNKPTDSELTNYESVAKTEENNQAIIDTRKKLYGSWESQLEEINEQGLDAWKERIAQIKADNPKES